MKILIIGSGGREFAIASKIKSSDRELFFAPGNGNTESLGTNIDIGSEDIDALVKFAQDEKIDYTIVGPEAPLCLGLVDLFEEKGLKVFGPNKKAAQFEGSKAFTKKFLDKYGIKTAKYLETESADEAYKFARVLLERDGKLVIKESLSSII